MLKFLEVKLSTLKEILRMSVVNGDASFGKKKVYNGLKGSRKDGIMFVTGQQSL